MYVYTFAFIYSPWLFIWIYLFTIHFSGDMVGGKSDNGITGKNVRKKAYRVCT